MKERKKPVIPIATLHPTCDIFYAIPQGFKDTSTSYFWRIFDGRSLLDPCLDTPLHLQRRHEQEAYGSNTRTSYAPQFLT